MSYRQFYALIAKVFFKSLLWNFLCATPILGCGAALLGFLSNDEYAGRVITYLSIIGEAITFAICLKESIEARLQEESSKLRIAELEFAKEKEQAAKILQCEKINHSIDIKRNERLKFLLGSARPFRDVAKMLTDAEMVIFNDSINHLKYKRPPAHKAAEEVRAMRQISAKILRESKEIEYKYEYILSNFPEIAEYVDNDSDLIAVSEHMSYSDLEDMRDRRKDYLSPEEYSRLTESQKSQLALDRYIQGQRKDKWQIGRDYEMSCAFQLRAYGYAVEMHGIKYGKGDLGRDLIASKNIGGMFGDRILIVQCKNWSHDRPIRENVIMQLYGTTIEYQISHIINNQEVVPVLVLPSYSEVSDTATKFAEKLKVRIVRLENKDFPRIKCNINNGSRIYHLPFDQQYDRTEIKLPGECYAYTVAEAESKGFRRAMRHIYTN